MTPKEKFWAKFKEGDEIRSPHWASWVRIRIERNFDKDEFQSSDGKTHRYDQCWEIWTPPAKSKKIVLKPYVYRSVYFGHANYCHIIFIEDSGKSQQESTRELIGEPTFNPSDGSYSIEVEE